MPKHGSLVVGKKPRRGARKEYFEHRLNRQGSLPATLDNAGGGDSVAGEDEDVASLGGGVEDSGEFGSVASTAPVTAPSRATTAGRDVWSGQATITVAVRVRPLSSSEQCMTESVATVVDKHLVVVDDPMEASEDVLRARRARQRRFTFDRAFGPTANQREVWEATCQLLIPGVLEGYNATVFAYGPTGAGKTYTMTGKPEQPGCMVQTLLRLFETIRERRDAPEGRRYRVTLSYLEVYNEMIRDLLRPGEVLELREDPVRGPTVAGIAELEAGTAGDVMELLRQGNQNRTQEATAANAESSRSHAVLQIFVDAREAGGDSATVGKLSLIDLAGSERASATQNRGQRLIEGANINRSLLALGNCINALVDGRAAYVPYRDSKLTRLLKDSLGGNSRTVMITNISPAALHFDETVNTLKYAARAKNIKTKVSRNVVSVRHRISQYARLITDLRTEIRGLRSRLGRKPAPVPRPTPTPDSMLDPGSAVGSASASARGSGTAWSGVDRDAVAAARARAAAESEALEAALAAALRRRTAERRGRIACEAHALAARAEAARLRAAATEVPPAGATARAEEAAVGRARAAAGEATEQEARAARSEARAGRHAEAEAAAEREAAGLHARARALPPGPARRVVELQHRLGAALLAAAEREEAWQATQRHADAKDDVIRQLLQEIRRRDRVIERHARELRVRGADPEHLARAVLTRPASAGSDGPAEAELEAGAGRGGAGPAGGKALWRTPGRAAPSVDTDAPTGNGRNGSGLSQQTTPSAARARTVRATDGAPRRADAGRYASDSPLLAGPAVHGVHPQGSLFPTGSAGSAAGVDAGADAGAGAGGSQGTGLPSARHRCPPARPASRLLSRRVLEAAVGAVLGPAAGASSPIAPRVSLADLGVDAPLPSPHTRQRHRRAGAQSPPSRSVTASPFSLVSLGGDEGAAAGVPWSHASPQRSEWRVTDSTVSPGSAARVARVPTIDVAQAPAAPATVFSPGRGADAIARVLQRVQSLGAGESDAGADEPHDRGYGGASSSSNGYAQGTAGGGGGGNGDVGASVGERRRPPSGPAAIPSRSPSPSARGRPAYNPMQRRAAAAAAAAAAAGRDGGGSSARVSATDAERRRDAAHNRGGASHATPPRYGGPQQQQQQQQQQPRQAQRRLQLHAQARGQRDRRRVARHAAGGRATAAEGGGADLTPLRRAGHRVVSGVEGGKESSARGPSPMLIAGRQVGGTSRSPPPPQPAVAPSGPGAPHNGRAGIRQSYAARARRGGQAGAGARRVGGRRVVANSRVFGR